VLVLAHFAMAAAGRSACERSRILATPRAENGFAYQNQNKGEVFLNARAVPMFGNRGPRRPVVRSPHVAPRKREAPTYQDSDINPGESPSASHPAGPGGLAAGAH